MGILNVAVINDLNRGVGPINTLTRSAMPARAAVRTYAAEDGPATKRAKRRHHAQIDNSTKSPYFSCTAASIGTPSIETVEPVAGTHDRRSSSGEGKAGSTRLPPTTRIHEFRNAQPKSRPSGARLRRRRGRKRMRSLATDGSIQSDPAPASESPDALAVDEISSARVDADILSSPGPRKRPRPSRNNMVDGPQAKRQTAAPSAPEKIEDSEDELQRSNFDQQYSNTFGAFPSRLKRPKSRGDIPHTTFAPASSLKPPKIPSRLRIRRAASGPFFFEENSGQGDQLFLDISHGRGIAPVSADGQSRNETWLSFDADKVNKAEHHLTHSPHVVISRPQCTEAPGRLYLEFADKILPVYLISDLSSAKCQEVEVNKLERIMDVAVMKAKEHVSRNQARWASRSQTESGPRASLPGQERQAVVEPSNHSRAREKTKERMQQGSQCHDKSRGSPSGDVERASRAPAMKLTRRYSPPISALRENATPRWTAEHAGWEKQWQRSLVYPPTGKNRATVDQDDIVRLDEGEFLNDNLINFYLRYLQTTLGETQPEIHEKVHIFSTFFFEKLRSTRHRINYDGVKSWTAKFDLFSYDYIVVPVNENAHWYLAIICNVPKALAGHGATDENDLDRDDEIEIIHARSGAPPKVVDVEKDLSIVSLEGHCGSERKTRSHSGHDTTPSSPETQPSRTDSPKTPTRKSKRLSSVGAQKSDPNEPKVITLDSLGMPHSPTCKRLREYLIQEAEHKKGVELAVPPNGMTAKGIPAQNNYCDCGIFVLGYVEEFLKNPDSTVRKLLQKEPVDWNIRPSELRNRTRDLLFRLQRQQHERLRSEKEAKRQKAREGMADKGVFQNPLSHGGLDPSRDGKSGGTSEPSPAPTEERETAQEEQRDLIGKLRGVPSPAVPVETFYSAPSSPRRPDHGKAALEEKGGRADSTRREMRGSSQASEHQFVRQLSSSPDCHGKERHTH